MPYQPINRAGTDIPIDPPQYDDLDVRYSGNDGMEQFEIEDIPYMNDEGFFKRASFMTKKIAHDFNNNVMYPMRRMIDPIAEGYSYLRTYYEKTIQKIGNPLVVKRLFYVFFITVIVFAVTKYDNDEAVNGLSGGGFSSGKFYDIDKLSANVVSLVDKKLMKENLEYFSSMPHTAGTKGDLTLARYVYDCMKNNGVRVLNFDELQSFINYPKYDRDKTYLSLSDGSHQAELFESHRTEMEYLSYNPNSLNTNEELESHFLYANFGTEEDIKRLVDKFGSIKDSIIFVKYGGSIPEANKVRIAQSYDVKAMVFITPKYESKSNDDTFSYENVIEKHNVGLTRNSPGDVLTPGWSSEDGYVTRLPWFKSESSPKIPTVPISWEDGITFLKKLEGKGYKYEDGFHSGSSQEQEKVKAKLRITNEHRPAQHIWNVIGSILGREENEKGIIIGASRDSNCFGTLSTNTGTVILLEVIRILTYLQRRYNWSALRTIHFVSFDATEYNLGGSTEWIESRKERLKKQGYAYIDLSDAISGDLLSIKSHPFFHKIIKEGLKKIKAEETNNDISTGNNLYDMFKKQNSNKDTISNNMIEQKNYIPFINMVNIPTMEIKFTGSKYPKNSCFDNFENFENRKIDSDMHKHQKLVESLVRIILTLSESPIIPYGFTDMADSLNVYMKDLSAYADKKAKEKGQTINLKYDQLSSSINKLKSVGQTFSEWCEGWERFVMKDADVEPSLLAMNRWRWNDNMLEFNSKFLSQDILMKRQGYVNLLFGVPFSAPDISNDEHEWNSFPKVRDALDAFNFDKAQEEIDKVASYINLASDDFLNI
ncbi:Piso0_002610 [Millerozyma farinosa CBS 7064]|uniref:Piso0_002610 protein n=1 Tax=Pichia sorbitophila (strain ATCC MYA-4447 / BCRC 22081 / CBS 7064 / NBRC 10061 / NRRL Y-12695) TaxID=559304 RepID=G8YFI1_PICSO|nr:Piso0_002610 [Millerozyma farinosa CBS 7064]